ncbi:MAG: hypothetical protein HYX92_15565 [Chloroflexi bacterium]|nr:hypothetical protein [Chloroflexota bacterium]
MSEYHYYEFQAIDRPLTREEMAELRAISTRATITPTRFQNVYSWGDLKADPGKLLEKYFDIFVYEANWRVHQVMFRLPRRLLDPELAELYCAGDAASSQLKGDYLILEFLSEDEDDGGWSEENDSEEWLPSLLPLRADLLNGDLRSLYLAWLLCAQTELSDDEVEPPVPPGLGSLTAPLEALVEFVRIDEDLIAIAAERSPTLQEAGPPESQLERWVLGLPASEKDALLLQFIRGDNPHLSAELKRRSQESQLTARQEEETSAEERRTVGELMAAAQERAERRKREEARRKAEAEARQAREEAARRAQYLDSLAGREEELWLRIESLVKERQPKTYDQAVQLLKDLRDLAARKSSADAFQARLNQLRQRHAKKDTFVRRLDEAELR